MDAPFSDKATLLRSIAERADLREGPSGVEEVLRAVYRAGQDPDAEPLAARALARMVRMPVPVITAIRRELEKEGVLQPGPHLQLTPEASRAMADTWGWGGQAAAQQGVICPECGGTGVAPRGPEWERVLGLLRKHFEANPRVDVTLDQSHCTPETNLRRVALMHEQGALAGKHVLVLGDDDSVSAAIALLGKVAGKDGRLAKRVVAVDTDERILRHLRDIAMQEGVIVGLVRHDLREPLPEDLRAEFDTVSTDPPYTLPGLMLFLSRAVEALYPEGGRIYLHFGHRPPDEQVEVQQAIASMGLVIEQMVPNFNEYVGAGVLAGVSDLYVLSATRGTEPLVTGEFDQALYTGQVRPTLRTYACTSCGTQYGVGGEAGGQFATIEALKEQGCPACGGTSFRLISRRTMPHNGSEGEP
ncbi:MAG TPA: bis-aminopropyl spermidine synthase family protein [Chloroflexia bacterium]|nr:bis-aminopropyl spermidine synthase family protein [Chloroflexia bacterium]